VNGWSLGEQAARIGRNPQLLSRLASGAHQTVSVKLASQISALHESLWDKRGPSARAGKLARARGWAPTQAWDDDQIDDPAAAPQGIRPAASSRCDRIAALLENSEELMREQGLTLDQAAERLGVSRNTLERCRLRHGLTVRVTAA
jgi:hypothetical protein